MALLEVKNLTTYYETKVGYNEALQGLTFDLEAGEILGLIGESGCGKSTAGFSIMNMIEYPGKIINGEVVLGGKDLIKMERSELRKVLWKDIAMIPQSAMNALNPAYKVGKQILEAIRLHYPDMDKEEAVKKVEHLMSLVGIDTKWYHGYPHKLSGGMKQRIIIAMALSCDPKVIISDEATTGLDVLIEAQILALLKKIALDRGLGLIVISHDLNMVTAICDRIGIMYAGMLVELTTTENVLNNPKHPYTKALFSSQVDSKDFDKKVTSVDGVVPKLVNPEDKCRFYDRCKQKFEMCEGKCPSLISISDNHKVACYLEGGIHE
ncbi:MAG TPA: dipeptide/oligopeptide/nickel ABC transporter ATP-binding protein [Clostridiales bacterium]|jgi:peptide/nickel transport system ATP-binding protein|nr:dipeptide/oligopeptide/nickel ABC transporter ATP-binding protein [Clostridiales bacterium]